MRAMSGLVSLVAGAALAAAPLLPAAGEGVGARPGADSAGDSYVGRLGNGGYDVSHYDLDVTYDPATDMLTGHRHHRGGRHAEPVALQPRPAGTDRQVGHGRRGRGEVAAPQGRAPDDARGRAAGGGGLHHGRGLRRRPGHPAGRLGLRAHRRRGDGHRGARGGRDVVPRQRPPERQGLLPLRRHGARRHHGRRQRRPARQRDRGRLDDVHVGRPRADGLLPGHRDDGALRPAQPTSTTASGCGTPSTPRSTSPSPRPARAPSSLLSQQADVELQAADADHHRPGRRRDPVVLGDPRDRAGLGPLLRRGPARRRAPTGPRCPTPTGTAAADTGASCPYWLPIHPFLTHYQSDNGDDTCSPAARRARGTPASGASDGPEQWTHRPVGATPAAQVEVSLTYASDDIIQYPGVFIDDVVVSTGEGSTSFEADGDTHGRLGRGRTARGEPRQREHLGRRRRRRRAAAGRAPPSTPRSRDTATSSTSSPRPSGPTRSRPRAASSTTTPTSGSRWRTRPGRSTRRPSSATPGGTSGVVVHELAHQWYGDSLAVAGVEAHLAQRGLRDVRGVAVGGARGCRHRAGDLRLLLRRDPARGPVLGRRHRRPGSRPHVRLRGVRARGHDAAPAAARRR